MTRNSYRVKYQLTNKDKYKVDDVVDGRGQQLVITDKKIGGEGEQVQLDAVISRPAPVLTDEAPLWII